MNLLCIGDIVSIEGRQVLQNNLSRLKRKYNSDMVIVNGENAALGNGLCRQSVMDILYCGADVITGGNHSFQKANQADIYDEYECVLRPSNIKSDYGSGNYLFEVNNKKVRVINVCGNLYMPESENVFLHIDKLLENVQNDEIVIVDFHAEASSEKQALGYYLDGKVSLVFGTHTHVQTADEKILKNGTGYISDIGMTGVFESVLGKDKDVAINNFKHPENKVAIKDAKGKSFLNGIFAVINDDTKKCEKIERIFIFD